MSEPAGAALPGGLPGPLLRLAEDLNAHAPPREGEERLETPRYVVCVGAGGGPCRTVVQRLRLAPGEVEAAVAEVRALLRARGRRAASWEVGPSATPADLPARLLRLGMAPDEGEPRTAGMVLVGRPAGVLAPEMAVHRVESREDYLITCAILERCFGVHGDETQQRAERERAFADYSAGGPEARYLASVDGVAVAAGVSVAAAAGVLLCGGATLPEARGRGAYRALVHARWHDAAGAALVTQAGAQSRPILRRMGFLEVAEIQIFRDVLG